MLTFAEYLLFAALACVVIALISNAVALTSRRRAAAPARREEALVSAGVGEGTLSTPSGSETIHTRRTEVEDSEKPKSSRGLGWYAMVLEVLALALLTTYLVIRMMITGHGPFANQHEFAVSFTWGILVVFVVFHWRFQLRALSLVVLPVTAGLLVYALALDTGVRPLIPALQNNLLLTLHVGFAILAYGAACVSFGAAVMYLLHDRFRLRGLPSKETLDEIGYKAAVVTYPLLTIMIVLGAVWANTAWGRYWGWDPKETAAFVTWLLYGAYLHARVVRDWRGTRSAWLLIIGFISVLFAYFGNHFFGGLHSYA
ncbi:MAG: c-type cytochrome biogenesis protein CcsB [Bowdeniella nasicola]|nr:c-type cytochrome biogenesis protein CcsB [Bowdeniella nasicola]